MDMKKEKKIAGMGAPEVGTIAANIEVADVTSMKTDEFNTECNQYRSTLAAKVQENQCALEEKLQHDPNYVGDRCKAVSTAYEYEAADIKMGGRGSGNWNSVERKELIERGKVRGSEAHHINSVAENPSRQTDPNNIRFYHSKKEHLEKGHNGDYRNPSSGELIDKDKMLRNTNMKRVIANETQGATIAVTVGVGMGVMSYVYKTCKEEGVSFKSIKKGIKNGGKPAMLSGLNSLTSYVVTRLLVQLIK